MRGKKMQIDPVATINSESPPPLAIRLMGAVEIEVHGLPLPRLRSRKGVWLLALLALRKGKPVERDWIAGTLWPDSSQSQALAYLRHCLTELRHALGTEAARLQSPTSQALALDLMDAEVDVVTFDLGIQKGDASGLQVAIAAYRGPLLGDCPEEWALLERGNREQSYLAGLRTLAETALERGDSETAIECARRIIAVDPLQEAAHRILIRALASTGDVGAAVQAYRDLRLHLHRELNTEPGPLTTELYNRVRAGARQKVVAADVVVPSHDVLPSPRRIPRPLTDLLGRSEEVAKVAARLRLRRLLTLTGTGGLGKTRLAVAVAEALAEDYADGAWFVELAGLSDPNLVVQVVASTLGVRDEAGRTLHESLVSFLRSRLLLLVLDNCEHLLETCAVLVSDVLDACSGVRILATSRQALGITGEVNWPVPLLPVPDLAHLPSDAEALLGELNQVASVRLFLERAEAVQKDFALTPRNALSVARICERLDGIPLAIELAAGNVKVLPIEQIARRLHDVLRLLTRGSRTAQPRQQTLQATLDWSYDLLTEQERFLLRRLSVFADGWTLEASEWVGSSTHDDGIHGSMPLITGIEVLAVLTSLVDKSMVQVSERKDCIRYLMLETVRQYAWDRLVENGESEAVRARHRDVFLNLAEAAERKLGGMEQGEWLLRLEEDHENLLAALDCSLKENGVGTALRFCRALSRFWIIRGHLSEGREWCVRILGKVEGGERATVLDAVADLASHQGDYASTRGYAQESLGIYEELGDRRGVAASLNRLGDAECNQDDYVAAQGNFESSLVIYRETGDQAGLAQSLSRLGRVANFRDEHDKARACFEESLGLYRALGDRSGAASCLNGLGNADYYQSDLTSARANYDQALALYKEIADKGGIAYSLNGLGIVASALAEHDAARSYYGDSLAIYQEMGDRRGIACLLHDLAGVAAVQRDHASAISHYQESVSISKEIGDRRGLANSLGRLGRLTMAEGDYSAARSILQSSLAIQLEIGNVWGIAESLESFGSILAHKGNVTEAVSLFAAAESLRTEIGGALSPVKREVFDRTVADGRIRLGEEMFAKAWEHGSTMAVEAAIEMALQGAEG